MSYFFQVLLTFGYSASGILVKKSLVAILVVYSFMEAENDIDFRLYCSLLSCSRLLQLKAEPEPYKGTD